VPWPQGAGPQPTPCRALWSAPERKDATGGRSRPAVIIDKNRGPGAGGARSHSDRRQPVEEGRARRLYTLMCGRRRGRYRLLPHLQEDRLRSDPGDFAPISWVALVPSFYALGQDNPVVPGRRRTGGRSANFRPTLASRKSGTKYNVSVFGHRAHRRT